MPLLRVEELSLNLGEFHLRNVSLSVEEGDYLAIIGPTGAGKSVLLEGIAGFYPLKSGRIFLNGREVTDLPPERRNMAIVYQDFMLFPHMSVFDNIAFGLRKKSLSENELKREVSSIAERLHIAHLLGRRPDTLSGGEKQRVALARALVVRPKLLLMDEPFSALDSQTREELRRLIGDTARDYGVTVIHVTHDFEDVFALATRVVLMRAGRVVQEGPPDEVFSKPIDDFAAGFVGTNVLRGEVVSTGSVSAVRVGKAVVYTSERLEPGQRVTLSLRPETIILARDSGECSARNALPATVVDTRRRGQLVWVTVDAGGLRLRVVVTPNAAELLGIKPGERFYALFKASSVRAIA